MPETTLNSLDSQALDPFSDFFASAPVLMHSVDRNGVLVSISAYWASRLGYTPEEMIGRPIMDFMDVGSAIKARADVMPELLLTSRVNRIRQVFVRKDGTLRPVLISAVALRNEDGEFVRSLSFVTPDDGADGLQQDLQAALLRAEEASNAKSRFLAAMSHEIRTPMNAILGFAQLLKLSDLDPKRRGHVDAIIAAGGQLMNLLTDLLDLSHMETGRMRIDARPTMLRKELDQVSDWWYSSCAEKGLYFDLDVDGALPDCVLSDPVRIQQILNNFIANALRYTDTGGVRLRVVQTKRNADICRIRMEVTDTGIGISKDQQAMLFRPFVQIESDFGKERGGWGLGLSICYNIATAMGADIGVISEPGAGSTFYFEMTTPIHTVDAKTEADTKARAQANRAQGAKVLIAEDNKLNQEVMAEMLRDLGHDVTVVSNGFEAVEALVRESFDVVLMDITMPGLDGLGATQQIRTSEGKLSSIPIIACTAHVGPDVQNRYLNAGIDDFLPKPVDAARLRTAIDRAIRGQTDGGMGR